MVKSRLSPVTVLYLSPERYFIHVKSRRRWSSKADGAFSFTSRVVVVQTRLFFQRISNCLKSCHDNCNNSSKATTTVAKATTTAAKATSNDNNDNCNKWKISSLQQKLLGRNSEMTKFLFLTFFGNKKNLKTKKIGQRFNLPTSTNKLVLMKLKVNTSQ